MSSSEWAAWVQAVGSVVALFVAIGVGWYQAARSADMAQRSIKHSEHLLEMQRVDRIAELFAAPVAVLEEFIAASKDIHQLMVSDEASKPMESFPIHRFARLGDARQSFVAITPQSFPSAPSVRLILDVKRQMSVVSGHVEHCSAALGGGSAKQVRYSIAQKLAASILKTETMLRELQSEAVRITKPD